MIKNKKSARQLTNEFFEVVKKRSTYKEEPSYAYQVGFLQAFIENVAELPKVRQEMELAIHNFLMEMNRQESRILSK